MPDWRDSLLRQIVPGLDGPTIAVDPDALLLDEAIQSSLRKMGFELLEYDDPIEFRFEYSLLDTTVFPGGNRMELIVIYRKHEGELNGLPHDLIATGRVVNFSLTTLFPNLSYPVISELDRSDFDRLYAAQQMFDPGGPGDNVTSDYILRHVFQIAPELIVGPSDLLRALLRFHQTERTMPVRISSRLVDILQQIDAFEEWPIDQIVPDRLVFLRFIQERWPIFLGRVVSASGRVITDEQDGSDLKLPGPDLLPFGHDDVRIYINDLFLEGVLEPVELAHAELLETRWMWVGIRNNPFNHEMARYDGLLQKLGEHLPKSDSRHESWIDFSLGWAELTRLYFTLDDDLTTEQRTNYEKVRAYIDQLFDVWLMERYAGLHNQPPVPPVMVHHIPRMISRYIDDCDQNKAALLVIDGLSLDQWVTLRESSGLKNSAFSLVERSTFAWIPTTTAVSRQAIFSGKAPLFYSTSIMRTDREPKLWEKFWVNYGLRSQQVAYMKGLGSDDLSKVQTALESPRIRVAGLVVDTVDKIMHGMQLGGCGMHNQINQWGESGYLNRLMELLVSKGFKIFLTSDHGNIEAVGIGKPTEGVIADQRGERARIYPDDVLRKSVEENISNTIPWPGHGLPQDFCVLLASGRDAFTHKGSRTVCHGGASMDEVLVPLIEISQVTS